MSQSNQNTENFRDTMRLLTKMEKGYGYLPKKYQANGLINGKFFSYSLFAFLFIAPFIKIGGRPHVDV